MLRLASTGDAVVLRTALTVYRVHGSNTTSHVHDEMYCHAVIALSEQLAPWLGADAAEAAQLIAWHIARRRPVTNRATLLRLGILLRRLVDAFVADRQPVSEDQAYIEQYTRLVYWQALRAGIRYGRVWLIGTEWARSAHSAHAFKHTGDVIGSLIVGALRLPMRVFLRDGRPNPNRPISRNSA